jgi:hypothetical protein
MSQIPAIPMPSLKRSALQRHSQKLLTRKQVDDIAEEIGVPRRLLNKLLQADGVRKYYPGRVRPLYVRVRVLELLDG